MAKKYPKYFQQYYPAWAPAQVWTSISLKPTVAVLVFLFMFGYAQQCLAAVYPARFCSTAAKLGVVALVVQLPNQVVNLGVRSLEVTSHAAERMSERQVTMAQVEELVRHGELFAYIDNRLAKIGYYDKNTGLFAAVDQRHKKLITVIRKTDAGYPVRLMTREKVVQSRRV